MNVSILLLLIVVIVLFIYTNYSKREDLTLRVATETDRLRAQKYALKKMCEKNGYVWKQFDNEFMYDCKYTRDTCKGESVYPTPDTEGAVPRYYEWRDNKSPDYKEAVRLESTGPLLSAIMGKSDDVKSQMADDGMCIMGSESFRKWCEDEKLRYDPTSGNCYTTKEYCIPKLLAFCDGDCFEPPGGMILSKVFGTTIGRALGSVTGDLLTVGACEAAEAAKAVKK